MKVHRVGIVGLKFGIHHVRTLALMDRAKIVAVADRHHPSLNAACNIAHATGYSEAAEMIESEDLDILVLSIPPSRRKPVLEQAARKGLAVFVEKPWAADSEQAAAMASACLPIQKKVTSGFSFRFLPAYQKLLSLVADEIGPPQIVQASYVWNYNGSATDWLWDPRNGNGFFNENSCHLLDSLNALLGRPSSVHAIGSAFKGYPSQDAAIVSLAYPDKKLASVTIGGIGQTAHSRFPSMDIWTSKGQATLQGTNHIWTDLEWSSHHSPHRQSLRTSPEALGRTRYTDAFESFFDSLESDTEPLSSIPDGMLNVRIAEAIYQSIRQGETIAI